MRKHAANWAVAFACLSFLLFVVSGIFSPTLLKWLSPKTVQYVIVLASFFLATTVGYFVWAALRQPTATRVAYTTWRISTVLLLGSVSEPFLPSPSKILVERADGTVDVVFNIDRIITPENIWILALLFFISLVTYACMEYLQRQGLLN